MSDITLEQMRERIAKTVIGRLAEEDYLDIPDIIETASGMVWAELAPQIMELKDAQTWKTDCLNCSSLLEENFVLDNKLDRATIACFELEKGIRDVYLALKDTEYGSIVGGILNKSIDRAKSPAVADVHWKTRIKKK